MRPDRHAPPPAGGGYSARSSRSWSWQGLVWCLGRDTPGAVDTQATIDAATAGDESVSDLAQGSDAGEEGDGTSGDVEVDEPLTGGSSTGRDDADADADGQPADGTDDLSGSYRVDRDAVACGFDGGTGSFVGFRSDEELSTVGDTTAVGAGPELDGSIVLDGTGLVEAVVMFDSQRRGPTSRDATTGSRGRWTRRPTRPPPPS